MVIELNRMHFGMKSYAWIQIEQARIESSI